MLALKKVCGMPSAWPRNLFTISLPPACSCLLFQVLVGPDTESLAFPRRLCHIKVASATYLVGEREREKCIEAVCFDDDSGSWVLSLK